MRATPPNVFALQNSGVETFLYADLGTELNGSTLTILSMLARLDRDPWAEAARWASLPRAGAIESLAQSIDQMPLAPTTLAEAHATAARLIQLLPTASRDSGQNLTVKTDARAIPKWLPVTLLYCAMAVGMAVSALSTSTPSETVVSTIEQLRAAPGPDTGPTGHAAVTEPVQRSPPMSLGR